MASVKREFDIESAKVRDRDLAKFFDLVSFFLQYQIEGYKEVRCTIWTILNTCLMISLWFSRRRKRTLTILKALHPS
jgi:hypothetical protein